MVDRDHRLGQGDRLEIRVEGIENLSRTVRLFQDGTFDYPVLGTVTAAGLTTRELAARISDGLKHELRRPAVTVTLLETYIPPKLPQVMVLGAATTRGAVDLPEPKPLRALLAQVGPTEKADLAQIRVRYPDGNERLVDYSQFPVSGQVKDEVVLKGGEEVVLLERPTTQKPDPLQITVLGSVAKAGSVEVADGATILDALDKAGGARPGADLARVTIEGAGHAARRVVDVERYLGGDTAAGYAVQRGDVIVVPEKPLRVLVFGEVVKPGEFPVSESTRVLDVYLQAGLTRDGDPSRAQLLRRGPDGKPIARSLNLAEIMRGRDRNNEVLRAGDVLFVPGKKQKHGFAEQFNLLTGPLWFLRNLMVGF